MAKGKAQRAKGQRPEIRGLTRDQKDLSISESPFACRVGARFIAPSEIVISPGWTKRIHSHVNIETRQGG